MENPSVQIVRTTLTPGTTPSTYTPGTDGSAPLIIQVPGQPSCLLGSTKDPGIHCPGTYLSPSTWTTCKPRVYGICLLYYRCLVRPLIIYYYHLQFWHGRRTNKARQIHGSFGILDHLPSIVPGPINKFQTPSYHCPLEPGTGTPEAPSTLRTTRHATRLDHCCWTQFPVRAVPRTCPSPTQPPPTPAIRSEASLGPAAPKQEPTEREDP